VAYLKHMGYYDDDQDIHLKVDVRRSWCSEEDAEESKEGVEISIKWEDKNCGSCSKASSASEFVQAISGPKHLRKNAINCTANTSID
jgi:hypothetical protein